MSIVGHGPGPFRVRVNVQIAWYAEREIRHFLLPCSQGHEMSKVGENKDTC